MRAVLKGVERVLNDKEREMWVCRSICFWMDVGGWVDGRRVRTVESRQKIIKTEEEPKLINLPLN